MGYHLFEGTSMDTDERTRLARSLGDNKAMIMQNHGPLTVGSSVGEAFVLMYWLQRACEIQMKVLASNMPWTAVPDDIARHYTTQENEPQDITEGFRPGVHEWPALKRLLDRDEPGYRN